jgi:hypothetical protein
VEVVPAGELARAGFAASTPTFNRTHPHGQPVFELAVLLRFEFASNF